MCGICHIDVLDKIRKASLTQGLILDTIGPSEIIFRRQHKPQCLFITTILPFTWLLTARNVYYEYRLRFGSRLSQGCTPVLKAESCWYSEASVVVSVKWAICHLGVRACHSTLKSWHFSLLKYAFFYFLETLFLSFWTHHCIPKIHKNSAPHFNQSLISLCYYKLCIFLSYENTETFYYVTCQVKLKNSQISSPFGLKYWSFPEIRKYD